MAPFINEGYADIFHRYGYRDGDAAAARHENLTPVPDRCEPDLKEYIGECEKHLELRDEK